MPFSLFIFIGWCLPQVPTQETIYKSLLLHEKQERQRATAHMENLSATAEFINIGLDIERTQYVFHMPIVQLLAYVLIHDLRCIIWDNVKIHKEHPVDHTQQDIDKCHEKLMGQLKLFHRKQQQLTPQVLAYVDSKSDSSLDDPSNEDYLPENTCLYLPSSFTAEDRKELDLVHMAKDEGKLCEGAANNAIFAIHNAVKDLSIACKNDWENGRSQDSHTRYRQVIRDAQCKLSSSLSNYHAARDAMIMLDVINEDDKNFRQIDARDIRRKNTFIKQSVGDSYHSDGKLWWLKMADLSQSDADDVTTQGNKRKSEYFLYWSVQG